MHCDTKSTWRWFRKYHDPRKASREQGRRDAKIAKENQNYKFEARNTKQIRMIKTKYSLFQTGPVSDFVIGI
jgi:hypothetical protein